MATTDCSSPSLFVMEGERAQQTEDSRTPWEPRTASPLDILLSRMPPHRGSDIRQQQSTESQMRISSSPRRSPKITESVQSPARSVYASMQQMDCLYTQPDSGMRTTDFFDDTSDEDSARDLVARDVTTDEYSPEQRRGKSKKRRSDHPDEPMSSQCERQGAEVGERDYAGYQPLTPSIPLEDEVIVHSPNSSLVDSVDELLRARTNSPPQSLPQKRSSVGGSLRQSTPNNGRSTERLSKFDQTLGAYAIAHDITLQALMRNEEGLDRNVPSYPAAVLQSANRQSLLRGSLRQSSVPRSPKSRHVSSPPTGGKKAHVTLPPIDVSGSRRSLPTEFVRTPFPFRSPEAPPGKETIPTTASNTTTHTESMLTLSIRQSNPSSRRRVTSLIIPASNDFSAIRSRSPRTKEHHFRALDFDDAAFFRSVQKCYRELMGPWRFFNARSLQRIVVSGPAMREADREYWVYPPHSPRMLTSNGLKDTFSQEKILQHYHKPSLGRSRYAFVHWAHRLAAAPPVQTPRPMTSLEENENGDQLRSGEQPEGLEFVVSWSVWRIALALALVFIVVVAAVLLWIFLGPNTAPGSQPHGGLHDVGDSVTTGVVLGICLLLLGLSGIAGWLSVSWLVM